MKFAEGNEIHWIACPESRKPHIGIKHGIEFTPIRIKGRFALIEKSLLILRDVAELHSCIVYPIGVSPRMAKQMEDESTPFCHVRDRLLKGPQVYSFF